jgi:hypothetical protein
MKTKKIARETIERILNENELPQTAMLLATTRALNGELLYAIFRNTSADFGHPSLQETWKKQLKEKELEALTKAYKKLLPFFF